MPDHPIVLKHLKKLNDSLSSSLSGVPISRADVIRRALRLMDSHLNSIDAPVWMRLFDDYMRVRSGTGRIPFDVSEADEAVIASIRSHIVAQPAVESIVHSDHGLDNLSKREIVLLALLYASLYQSVEDV